MIRLLMILLFSIFNCLFVNGENIHCDENMLNDHLMNCYQEHLHPMIDLTSDQKNYFLQGNSLCKLYHGNVDYRQCFNSIFNEKCSFEKYPLTYFYGKIFWKLAVSSCSIADDEECSPSPLRKSIINKCHYSFDQYYPTKCKRFLNSLKCLEENEEELIPRRFQSECARKKAYYYYYGDVAARLQLAINICEQNSTDSSHSN